MLAVGTRFVRVVSVIKAWCKVVTLGFTIDAGSGLLAEKLNGNGCRSALKGLTLRIILDVLNLRLVNDGSVY
jgi:hypothetical protein